MKKDDILRKVQYEKKDEREEQVKTKAFHVGWISVTAVMLFLIIWRSIHNESANDILMILMAQTSATSFYQYTKMPEKKMYLMGGILGIIGLGLALASLLSQYGVY
ncbi:MAG: hypothetical protein JJT76_00720 [Clostridiaceae bacterium]|nr:hypothetical protein [Clostridiaceae bacterium]